MVLILLLLRRQLGAGGASAGRFLGGSGRAGLDRLEGSLGCPTLAGDSRRVDAAALLHYLKLRVLWSDQRGGGEGRWCCCLRDT